ncbi:MAG: hypothetical protein EBY41_04195 [Proteobacteria bacterium]|nr:hypothetical protein [Pseudomonadota bacterium]
MAYVQKNNPFPITSCGRRRAGGIGSGFKMVDDSPLEKRKRKRKPDVRRTIGPGKNFNKAKDTGTGVKHSDAFLSIGAWSFFSFYPFFWNLKNVKGIYFCRS